MVCRRHRWSDLYSRSCIIKLQDNLDDLKSKGITIKKIKLHILGDKPESSVEDRAKNRRDPIKLKFQRTAHTMIKNLNHPNFQYRIREKLTRWKLGGVEAKLGAIVHRRMLALQKTVAPRVQAAVFSTIWNRWCTHRRYQ